MKTLYRATENTWFEIVDKEDGFGTFTRPADEDSARDAQAIYETHMIAGATLLTCEVILPSGHGLINCRHRGAYKKIRF